MAVPLKKIREQMPKGYWWTYDIDKKWKHPKQYYVRGVISKHNTAYITIQETYKTKPWPEFTGRHSIKYEDFLKLEIYKTKEAAKYAYYNRKCPHCGGVMKYANTPWCKKCVDIRHREMEEYLVTHTFKDRKTGEIYYIGYNDEYSIALFGYKIYGYDGAYFKFKIIDTGEVIMTNNLWHGDPYCTGTNQPLPEIEFL